ncbi:MAG: hypothetical protein HKO04_01130 [Silicimonas sp.]|nr:hypothetical protein [Silicimonas sp.]
MSIKVCVAVLTIVLGSPVFAQSSLGIAGMSLDLGSTEDEAGEWRGAFASSVDVRITGVHGLQGDLAFSETAGGTIGSLGAHVYMAPRPGQKYGLFFNLSDVDGRSMAWASAGAEGMFRIAEGTIVEGRIGLGAADGNSLDYIFGGASLVHALSPAVEIEAAFDIADFDEAAFRATSLESSLTARYSPEGAPWGLYASLIHSDLTGRDGARGATRIGLGVTYRLGTSGGVDTDTRPFRAADPVAPLVRRGLW